MRPTQRQIAKILDDMSNIGVFDPDGFDDELWWVTCVDPMGQRRANGTGVTAMEAMAAAWVNTFLPPCSLAIGPVMRVYDPDLEKFANWKPPVAEQVN